VHDSDLRRIARDVAEFGDAVLFRLNNEMNGDWVVYSGYWTSQDAEIFKAVWRHLFRIFQEEGATNAIWVWNPHDRSFPPFAYNHALMYDPGPRYYDVVGLTGYNNGTYYPNEAWRTFDEIYRPLYDAYVTYFPDKPFMITEFASSSIGGDKAAWIRDALTRLTEYPKIKIAIWWNDVDMDGDRPARPYRLEGEAVLDAFTEGLARYRYSKRRQSSKLK
jgi:beta-mannanase